MRLLLLCFLSLTGCQSPAPWIITQKFHSPPHTTLFPETYAVLAEREGEWRHIWLSEQQFEGYKTGDTILLP